MKTLPLLPANAPFAAHQIQALNGVMAETNPEQRAWLSGFLAGYQAAGAPQAAAAPAAKVPLTILFATESGNSETLAGQAKKAAGRLGFAAKTVDMADVTPADIAKAENLLVLVSTWGEGDPPQRAAEFYAALMGDGAPRFERTRFAVLALGDSAYVNFCDTGKRIDARLEALGAERIAARIDLDLDYETPANAWIGDTLAEIKKKAGAGEEGGVIHVDFARPPEAETTFSKTNPFEAEITELVNLNSSRSSKETVHMELSLASSGIVYEPGDAFGVLPMNDSETVEAVASAVGLGGDTALHEALTERHDVTTLTRPVVQGYAELTGDKTLAELAGNTERLAAFLEGRQVIDLFEAFPHKLAPTDLTKLLRPLPWRFYSVASSHRYAPDEAHLLVGAVRYRTHDRDRKGVTSTYLSDRRRVGDTVKLYLKPNKHFRLPNDPSTPVIMVGPGTGIAPFRGFMQEREAVGADGKNWLFFGDRNYTHDFLYQLEWQDFLKDGVLTRLDVAFSRDQPEKVYVQDRMWSRRRDLYAWLEEGAHFYVCGDEKLMAKDVHAMLARIIADQGGKDAEATEAYINGLVRAGRYQRDVY
jgi:sulfite reductase (NADPH) flavoprotein alpha-component